MTAQEEPVKRTVEDTDVPHIKRVIETFADGRQTVRIEVLPPRPERGDVVIRSWASIEAISAVANAAALPDEELPVPLRRATAADAAAGRKVRAGGAKGRAARVEDGETQRLHQAYVEAAADVCARARAQGARLPNGGPLTLHGLCCATARKLGDVKKSKTVKRALEAYVVAHPKDYAERFAGVRGVQKKPKRGRPRHKPPK